MSSATLDTLTPLAPVLPSDLVPIERVAPPLMRTTVGALVGLGRAVIAPSGDTSGATDTAAIQAALTAGQSVKLLAGVYYTDATLTISTAVAGGLTLAGSGPTDSAGGGASATIIRPTSAVSAALTIDGSPFEGYVLGVCIRDLTIDMTHMSAAKGIQLLQAFDCSINRVRSINDSTSSGIYIGPGCYTTEVRNFSGYTISIIGTGTNDPTTISIINPDIRGFAATYCANVTFVGGAIQPAYYSGMTVVHLAPNASTTPIGLTNTAGIYLILGSYISNSQAFTLLGTDIESGGGFPSTYNDGTHGTLSAYPVFQIGGGTTGAALVNPLVAGIYLYDIGANSTLVNTNLGGGTRGNVTGVGQIFTAGLSVTYGGALGLFSDAGATRRILLDGSNGNIACQNLTVSYPNTGANFDFAYDAAGNTIMAIYAAAGALGSGGGNTVFFPQTSLAGYTTQAAGTQSWYVNSVGGYMWLGTGTLGTAGQDYVYLHGNTGVVDTGNGFSVGGHQVVGAQIAGWGSPSGGTRGAPSVYAGQTMASTYSQSAAQTTDNAVKALSAAVVALMADLKTHGLIAT